MSQRFLNLMVYTVGMVQVNKDDVHGDRVKPYEEVPKHKIKYYFVGTQHPIVFYQYCQSCDV